MPRRKPGTLLPLESEILETALAMLVHGDGSFHGFALAQLMRDSGGSRTLVGHGTLYKALGRLEEFGLLTSQWEAVEGDARPRRRIYELTESAKQAVPAPATARRVRSNPRPA
jgi:DNA-binding PadR family transcriptional regulator